jgi:hypothetical protein
MGDSGIYRIPEYHLDSSHIIAENEDWWIDMFTKSGWKVKTELYHLPGIKDNWYVNNTTGNRVFYLEKDNDNN